MVFLRPNHYLRKYLLSKIPNRFYRIYILPTKIGFYFLAIIFILFVISLSYGNALGYASTFIFVAVVMTSATHTHFNLKNVRVLSFSGQKVIPENEHYQLNLNIAHENRTKKFDLTAKYEHAEITGIDRISINERKTIIIKFNKLKRGWYRFNRITLMTTFPFGLFYSWTYVDCAVQFFVCPESIGELPLPEKRIEDDNVGIDKELGFSEFNEHKKHTNGMPYNRVDWKLYAKEKGMYVKNFEREQSSCSFFSLEYLSIQFPKLDLEQALGQLATWMKLSNESGGYWVLGLKEYQSYAGTGDLFLKECLIILAKYQRNEVELVI